MSAHNCAKAAHFYPLDEPVSNAEVAVHVLGAEI